jgi:hypothetical protein
MKLSYLGIYSKYTRYFINILLRYDFCIVMETYVLSIKEKHGHFYLIYCRVMK